MGLRLEGMPSTNPGYPDQELQPWLTTIVSLAAKQAKVNYYRF